MKKKTISPEGRKKRSRTNWTTGATLIFKIRKANLTCRKVASILDINPVNLSHIMNGRKTSKPVIDFIMALPGSLKKIEDFKDRMDAARKAKVRRT